MKKLPMIVLIGMPYLFFLLFFVLISMEGGLSAYAFSTLFFTAVGMAVLIAIPNMIYAFLLPKFCKDFTEEQLLFWNVMIKAAYVPVYVVVFALGMIALMTVIGMGLLPFLFLFDCMLLLPSSMYGISGLFCAYRKRKVTVEFLVVNIVFHFLFCLDLVSAACSYVVVRKKRCGGAVWISKT